MSNVPSLKLRGIEMSFPWRSCVENTGCSCEEWLLSASFMVKTGPGKRRSSRWSTVYRASVVLADMLFKGARAVINGRSEGDHKSRLIL